jgi:hypothetical protein
MERSWFERGVRDRRRQDAVQEVAMIYRAVDDHRLRRPSAVGLLVAMTLATPAYANDSSAELATGGLVFTRNDQIEMRTEDLFISAREIRVRYRFFNRANRDVRVTVAFPMPDIRIEHQDQNISVPTEDPINLLAFTTRVNGNLVNAQAEQRVFAAGIDRTQLLHDLGIPLAPHLQSANQALDRLPRQKWDELLRLGLAEIEEYDVGKGMEKHLSARWTLRTNFYWQQTFPAAAETAIEHRYKPSVGASAGTSLGSRGATTEPWFADYRRKYCMDRQFLAAIDGARRAARSDFGAPFSEERIDYILAIGANWSGPIRDFRLVIDKGDADSLVSFCGEGVRKIGPTQFEMRKANFTPRENLSVLILKRVSQQ